ncbi:MAG: hypothetical protein KDI98_09520, partial [Hyphomicrobiaceae bacterium]|nr:hypothetical protein [Hyphomicrobiaceae bacterium]
DTGFRRDGSMFGGNGPSIVDYRPSRSPRAEPENMRPRVCRQPRERPSAEDLIAAYGQAVPTTTYVAGFAGNARDEIFANVEAGEEEDGGANAVLDQVIGAVVRADSPRALVTGGTVGAAAAPRGLYAPPNPEPRPGSFAAAAATPASVTAPAPATTPAPASVPAAPRRAVPQPGIRPSILGE